MKSSFKDRVSWERAFLNSKALPAGWEATAQLKRLALSATSIRRERHESVMSIVMEGTPNGDPDRNKKAPSRKNTRPA
jgi:hypothetical protein